MNVSCCKHPDWMPANMTPENQTHSFTRSRQSWVYGWTHHGKAGQTRARMDILTRAVEIRDSQTWVRCVAGSDEFFTPYFQVESLHLSELHNMNPNNGRWVARL